MLADIGSITNPNLVIDKLIEADVAPLITILYTDFKNVFRVF